MAKINPSNMALAKEKLESGWIKTIGIAVVGDIKFTAIEYQSRTSGGKELIYFAEIGDEYVAYHECEAAKSGYARGCWHLGLLAHIYNLGTNTHHEVRTFSLPPDNYPIKEDLTPSFLGLPGEFSILKLQEPKIKNSEEFPKSLSEKELKNLPEEDKFLAELNLPKDLLDKILPFRNKQKDRLTAEQKMRIPRNVEYIPQGKEVAYAVASMLYDTWAPPLLMGPAGAGKSTLAELIAEILYLPLRRISGGIDVNAEYLLGSKTLSPSEQIDTNLAAKISYAAAKTGFPLTPEEFAEVKRKLTTSEMQVVHEPGVLLQAITDGEMILVDEINMLIPEVTSILHSLLDWQKSITVSGVGEVKAHDDFRLISAMNVGYMGTRPLNKAFRDRFRGIQVSGIDKVTLVNLLKEKVDEGTAQKLAEIYQTLYENVYSPVGATLSEDCLSLRSLLRAAEEYSMGLGSIAEITLSCLTESLESPQDREQVKDLIEMQLGGI